MGRAFRPILFWFGLIAGVWSLAWFGLAFVVNMALDSVTLTTADGPAAVVCGERKVTGFPFEFRVECAGLSANDARQAVSGALAAMTVSVELSNPSRITASAVSPVTIRTPFFAEPIEASWEEADANLDIALTAWPSPSFDGRRVAATIGDIDVAASRFLIRAEPSSDDRTLKFKADAAGLSLATPKATTAATDLTVDATLAHPEGRSVTEAIEDVARHGLAIPTLGLDIRAEGSRISASGRLALDRRGMLDGEIDVGIVGVERLPGLLARWPEAVRVPLAGAIGGTIALARPGTIDGEPAKLLKVVFKDGEATIGAYRVTIGSLFGGVS